MKKLLLSFVAFSFTAMIMAQALSLPFTEDFESSTLIPETFTLINVDGNTPASANENLADSAFVVEYSSVFESYIALGVSYYDPDAGADDWLILPKLALTNNPVLSWKAVSLTSSGNYPDSYEVLVSTTDTETASFTKVFEVEEESSLAAGGEGIQRRTLDLSAYAGQEVYIAFRLMTPSPGGDRLGIDDIRVEEMLMVDFENGIPENWTIIDANADDRTWDQDDYDPFNGEFNASLDTYEDGETTDDWMITNKITVTADYELTFYAQSSSDTYKDDLYIKASKTGVAAADFTIEVASIVEAEAAWTKYTYVLSENADLEAGDEIYIGFYSNSEGSYLNVDDVRYGALVPPAIVRAYAISETAVDVVFDVEITDAMNAADFALSGTADITFTEATIDADDASIIHLTGASENMAGDITVDNIAWGESSFDFYAGIMPLNFTSLTNDGGYMEADEYYATFTGIVHAVNDDTSRVWFADADGAHHSVNSYDLNVDEIALGDEILIYGKLSPYENQTEVYPAYMIEIVSSDNTIFGPMDLTAADILSTTAADTDPAEKYEGVLATITNVEILQWDGAFFVGSDDGGTNTFYIGNTMYAFNGTFDETSMSTDDVYTITGVVVNKDGYYAINPRGEDDLMVTTSVETEIDEITDTKVYPVPARERLNLENVADFDKVVVINMIGIEMIEKRVENNRMELNISELPNGMYMIGFYKGDRIVEVKQVAKR